MIKYLKNIHIPSDINNFKKVINSSLKSLEEIDHSGFFSPYSIIPIISQALSLNTPMMGSGNSPYSIFSIIFHLKGKDNYLNDMFAIPLIERRRIIDEIYEMIGPYLLGEEQEYIELLVNTKYRCLFKYSKKKTQEFKQILKDKFCILSQLIDKFNNKQGDFGYLVHYGYPEDLSREYNFLDNLPEDAAREWRDNSYPIVNEIFMDNFPLIYSETKKSINGWILFITNYTRELLEDGKLRKRKILQAARLAERLGAKIIGMGGLIGSFAQGGYYLSEEIKGVGFTTGHAYTIGNILEIMDNCTDRVGMDIKTSAVAIVGAAGSIGSGCAQLLAEKFPREIILVDLSNFNAMKRLKELEKLINTLTPATHVLLSADLKDIKQADIVISATNSPTSILRSEHLKPGAIIIDDAFPKNVSKDILNEREDIILLEGGIMGVPLSINVYFSRNMPDLMDVPITRLMSCKETYGCAAEVFTLALYGYNKNYGLGAADPHLAKDILTKAKREGFSSAPLQCFDEAVDEERLNKVAGMKREIY